LRSKNMFTTGAAPAAAGAAGGGLAALGGGPAGLLASLGGKASGLVSSLANLFGLSEAGPTQQRGFSDLEDEIRKAIAGQRGATTQSLGLLSPFRAGGAQALQQELGLLGGPQVGLPQQQDPTAFINQALSKFQQSPAQKAQIQAGLTAVQNRLGAQGLGQSGAEQEALEQFAQRQTGQQQQQFLQNVLGEQARQQAGGALQLQQRQQLLSALQGLGGLGLGAAQSGVGATQAGASNIADLLESLGMTQLGGAQARAQQQEQQAGGIGSLISGFML
jgi:hypothetical protein